MIKPEKSFGREVSCVLIFLSIIFLLFAAPAFGDETIEVRDGLNLFTYPVIPETGYTSYDLMVELHAAGDVVSLQRFDSQPGTFQTTTWHNGTPAGIEFLVNSNDGYFIYSRETVSITFEGQRDCSAVQLQKGFNLSGFPCPPGNYDSADLMHDLGGEETAASIKKYDAGSGSYRSSVWNNGVVSGDIFPITHGEAYIVNMQEPAGWGSGTGPTYISGIISEDTQWEPLQGPYIIIGGTEVAAGAELRILPGTEIIARGHYRIQVNGTLDAIGTVDRPIIFTAEGSQRWEGIYFDDGDSGSQLTHCEIEKAEIGIFIKKSSPLISSSLIRDNDIGIYIGILAQPTILQSSIINNAQYGIHLFGDRNDAHNPIPQINENNIHSNGMYDLKAENFAYHTPARINARNNWWGTAGFLAIKNQIYDRIDYDYAPFVDFSGFLDSQGGRSSGSVAFGIIDVDTTWTLPQSPYWLAGNVEVAIGATLTVEPGVEVKAGDGYDLLGYGIIRAEGTVVQPIRFLSYEALPEAGDWSGISLIGNGSSSSRFSYCTVEHADYGLFIYDADPEVVNCVLQNNVNGVFFQDAGAVFSNNLVQNNSKGLFVYINASPDITLNTIRNNSEFGIYIRGDQNDIHDPDPIINNNSITDNGAFAVACENFTQNTEADINARGNWWGSADFAAIKELIFDRLDSALAAFVDFSQYLGSEGGATIPGTVVSGNIESDETWTLAGSPYRLIDHLSVDAGITLTIEAGVIAEAGYGYGLTVNGTLSATGTEALPITFTSYEREPQPGDWSGIEFTATGNNSVIDHCVIEYAQQGIACYVPDLTVIDSVVEDNNQGIYVGINAAPDISGVTAVNNTQHGIAVCGDLNPLNNPAPQISGSNLFNNGEYDLYACNFGDPAISTVTAAQNWWGTTDDAQIQTHIHDQLDDADAPVVDYSALAGETVGLPVVYGMALEAYFSPNADGVKDSLAITADLTRTCDWEIRIQNAEKEVINTYNGTGNSISQIWDGTDSLDVVVADGIYLIRILAADPTDSSLARHQKTEVDNTLPQAVLTDPAQGNILFNQTSIVGTASDSNFVQYVLEYSPSTTPDLWSSIGLASDTAVIEDLLQTWITNDTDTDQVFLENGTYNLRLQVEDRAGNVGVHRIAVDLNNLYVAEVTNETPIFDVSVGEKARVCFGLNQAAAVTLKVYPERDGINSPPVRTVTQTFTTAGSHCIEWDGKNENGNLVLDDAYVFVLEASSGEITDGFIQTEDPHSVPGTGNIDPKYDPYSNDPFQMTYTLPEPARLTMTATPLGSSAFTVIAGRPYLAGDLEIIWDGRYPNGGIITVGSIVAFSAVSLRPNHFIMTGNSPAVSSIQSDPFRIYISYGEYTKLNYTLNHEAYITIKLLPPGVSDYHDPAAILVQDRLLQTIGDYEMVWDGLDPADANGRTSLMGDDGAYNVGIQARNPVTLETTIYYGAVNLLR